MGRQNYGQGELWTGRTMDTEDYGQVGLRTGRIMDR